MISFSDKADIQCFDISFFEFNGSDNRFYDFIET